MARLVIVNGQIFEETGERTAIVKGQIFEETVATGVTPSPAPSDIYYKTLLSGDHV